MIEHSCSLVPAIQNVTVNPILSGRPTLALSRDDFDSVQLCFPDFITT